jgi:2-polyprenyl-6-methoxyphenol hydroxylase-like FAD-dependent oxidoreductase
MGKLCASSHVAIVGGSMAGCSAYIALNGLVDRVTILERSSTDGLQERGMGIGLPGPVLKRLEEKDFIDTAPGYRCVQVTKRKWICKDASSDDGRLLWEPPMLMQTHNWGLLWSQLRKRVPDEDYKKGISVSRATFGDDKVELYGSDDQSIGEFDFVIRADGSSSSIWEQEELQQEEAKYGGYLLWRGSFSIKDYKEVDVTKLFDGGSIFFTPVFDGGHGVFYLIPSNDNQEGFLVNWAIYTAEPPGMVVKDPKVIHSPSQVSLDWFYDTIVDANLPPTFARLVKATPEISIHPIVDRLQAHLADRNAKYLLLGDSGATLRPHTASGTSKALVEAELLQTLCSKPAATWAQVCEQYQKDRYEDGKAKVELGKRLGQFQVLDTPPWEKMTPEDFQNWTTAQMSGAKIFFIQ